MIKVNLIKVLKNRLLDRGWFDVTKEILRNKEQDIQLLERETNCLVCVENVYMDASIDLTSQVDSFFKRLERILEKSNSKALFLPGGGDIPIPDFFKEFCIKHNIDYYVVTLENFKDIINYDK